MSINKTINGITYTIPESGDAGWGDYTTLLLTALVDASIFTGSGTTKPITVDLNLGPNYGLVTAYLTSRSSNPAQSGVIRLANGDLISWRNGANDNDIHLTVARGLATPPGSPTTGVKYYIIPVATDAWVGKEGQMATWDGSSWSYEEFDTSATSRFIYNGQQIMTGPSLTTDNEIARMDGTDGKLQSYTATPPTISDAGAVTISNATSSTDKDTGALIVEGGVGIEENLNVGGVLKATSISTTAIDADINTISNLEVDNLKAGVLDTDLSTVSASDDTIPSAKATKAYADSAASSAVTTHINDTTDAHAGSAITNTPSGNLSATTVQAALNELQGDIDTNAGSIFNHISDTDGAHAASAISNTPAGNIASTTVQAALNEIQSDVDYRIQSMGAVTDNRMVKTKGVTGLELEQTGITVDDSNNISGAANVLGSGVFGESTTGAITIPAGTDGERPTAALGKLRYNTSSSALEIYDGADWSSAGGGGGGLTVDAVTHTIDTATLQNGKHYVIDMSSASADIEVFAPSVAEGYNIKVAVNKASSLYKVRITAASGDKLQYAGTDYDSVDIPAGSETWVELAGKDITNWAVEDAVTPISGTFSGDLEITGSLTPSGGIVGKTDGVAVASGYIGERIDGTPSSFTAQTDNVARNASSITLNKGIYNLYAVGVISRSGGSQNIASVAMGITTTSGENPLLLANMKAGRAVAMTGSGLGLLLSPGAAQSLSHSIGGVNVTTDSTTYYCVLNDNGGSYDGDATFYAIRIA